ncbi:MAG: hypothetical protein E7B11_07780 [Clostridiales bacterium]|nr:hypothetical protein [Clostridiales bacterium]MDU3240455.1 hypothetical protein [Clostridiales bacterium]
MGFILQNRDIQILQQVTKYRFLLSRQIKVLCGFSGQRSCDRRTKKLIDEGLLEKKHFLYGIPALYMATEKAKRHFDLRYITKNLRVEHIEHNILAIDTAIYLIEKCKIYNSDIISERQIKNDCGFGKPQHIPDLVYTDRVNKKCCVEIELNVKQFDKLKKNILQNYKTYDKQLWVVDTTKEKIVENLKKIQIRYSDIIIQDMEEVKTYVKTLQ